MSFDNIEDVVRNYVAFKGHPSADGWEHSYCEYCGDGHRTKGPRANWLFSDEMLFFNCYNCGGKGNFDPHREAPFSKAMYGIFKSFGIPLRECYALIPKDPTAEKREVKPQKLELDSLEIPDHFYTLASAADDDVKAMQSRYHLINKRSIDPDSFPFYLSTGFTKSSNPGDISMARTFKNRLIIPSYMNDRLIGYEGMALEPDRNKYITVGRNLFHGYGNIYSQSDHVPIFITEGFFDAWHLNGVALTTNALSNKHIELLEKSPRPKVVVPDRGNTHNALAEGALEQGWGVSLPDIKPYKDVCKAIEHYGVFFVLNSIINTIKYGDAGRISLKIYNIA